MIDRRAITGLLTIVVATVVFVLVFARVPHHLLSGGGDTVRARIANPLGLVKNDPVRIAGVQVGTVRNVELADDARSALVELSVDEPVFDDASVAVRERTLLGANFAVVLDPGTPSAGKLDGTIEAQPSQVELEDVVNTFTPNARGGMRDLLTELPRGLADADAPRAALQALDETAPDLVEGLEAVRGRRDGDLRRLIENSERAVVALDDEGLRDIVDGGTATLETTAARRAEIQATLRTAAPMLPRVRETARALDGTLALADPLIADLQAPAGDIAPTVTDLQPVVTGASRLLGNAQPLLRSLRPAATELAATARAGTPVLRGLTPAITRLQTRILRDLELDSPESGHNTFEMIGPALAGVVGASAGYDRSNNFIRFLASGGEKALQFAPCSTSFLDPTSPERINCDLFFETIAEVFP